jgi:hypothetical protein
MKRLFLGLLLLAACAKKKDAEPAPPAAPAVIDAGLVKLEKLEVPEVHIKTGAPTTVGVKWSMPKDTAVNDEAPFRIRWNRSDGLAEAPTDVRSTGARVKEGFTVEVEPMKGATNPTLGGTIDIVVCDSATHAVCVPVHRSVELGFVASADAPADATVTIPLPEAKAH